LYQVAWLWYDAHKYAMNKANFDDIMLWKNYKPKHIMKDNWEKFQEFMTSNEFKKRL
jgi:hypothetical protein